MLACMGGTRKPVQRRRARQLRADGWTLAAIAAETNTSKGTVSRWVRDVAVSNTRLSPSRATARSRPPNALERAKAAQIAALLDGGRARVGALSDGDLLIART